MTAGTVETTTSERRSDWKFAASIRKITTTARISPVAKAVEQLLAAGTTWPRRSSLVFASGGPPDLGQRSLESPPRRAEVGALNVGRHADDAGHVVALVRADRRAGIDVGHVAQQDGLAALGRDRDVLQILDRRGLRLAESALAGCS